MLDKFGGKEISAVLLFRLRVPASQESEIVVQGASPNITQQTAEQIRSLHSKKRTTCSGLMKTALNNVVLPTLFNVVNNIVQHC